MAKGIRHKCLPEELSQTSSLKIWPWIGILADDLLPETINWDGALISQINGMNIVAANDGYQAPKQANEWRVGYIAALFVSRAVGYFTPPGMSHLFVDDVWETLGSDTGCVTWAMGIMVRPIATPQSLARWDSTVEEKVSCPFGRERFEAILEGREAKMERKVW